jgi:4-hydroxy-tetrahydrodipicolinate reductase
LKIALIGYGKMGKLVETLAVREGWEIGPRLDIHNNPNGAGITTEVMQGVDVGIDFSQPDAVLTDIEAAARAGLNLVVGTTGWYQARDTVEKIVRESGIGLVYGSNFSVGMNLFFEIVAHAARVIGNAPQYDPYLAEQHHRAKKDAPSGTALSLRDLMGPYLGARNPGIASIRAGHIPGNHAVGFDSEADTIILEHRARSRQGFAEGALLAARWIQGRKGFFDFRDVFHQVLGVKD